MKKDFHKQHAMGDVSSMTEALLDAEEKYDLNAIKYRGFPLWRLFRTRFFSMYIKREKESTLLVEHSPLMKLKKNVFRVAIHLRSLFYTLIVQIPILIIRLIFTQKGRNSILFISDAPLREQNTKKGLRDIDVFIDPIMDLCSHYDCLYIRFTRRFREKLSIRPDIDGNILKLTIYLLTIIALKARLYGKEMSIAAKEMSKKLAFIHSSFASGDNSWQEDILLFDMIKWNIGRKIYELLFRFIKPATVIMTCAFGKEDIVAACKLLNIKVIERQHGVLSTNHYGYNFTKYWLKDSNDLLLPDHIITFGNYWSKKLLEGGFWREHQLSCLGLPYLEFYRERRKQKQSFTRNGPRKRKMTILVTSSGLRSTNEFLADLIIQTITYIETINSKQELPEIKWLIKNHPSFDKKSFVSIYERIKRPSGNVQLITDSVLIYNLLERADLHISVRSTAHFEALALGVPTCIALTRSAGLYSSELAMYRNVYTANCGKSLYKALVETTNERTLYKKMLRMWESSYQFYERWDRHMATEILSRILENYKASQLKKI